MSTSALQPKSANLSGVRHILAVSSCKGGVGKSTTAVNLAWSMRRAGLRVGIFDADIYGPSLPTLVDLPSMQLQQKEENGGISIVPLEKDGVKLMSFGYITQGSPQAAIMRGPRVHKVIETLLQGTEWGELDALVIDFPPGTGDIQLSLGQLCTLSGAVIVTTPQKLSLVDVEKGIRMFEKLDVPTLAVVENMSWLACPSCGEKQRIFGEGAARILAETYGFKDLYEVPILPDLSSYGDTGRVFADEHPDHDVSRVYRALGEQVWQELVRREEGRATVPTLSYNVGQAMLLELPDGSEHEFDPADLRRVCRCAHCVDEMSGEQILDPASVDSEVYPAKIAGMGNYAVAVEWSDGHSSSIYPFEMLIEQFGTGAKG